MDLPDINPKDQLIYTTTELISALRVSPNTFYKYLRLAALTYRKKKNTKAQYYDYSQAMTILNLIYTPKKIFSLLKERQR